METSQEKLAALGGAASASHEGRGFVGDDVVLLLVLVVLVALAVVLLVAVTLLVRFGGAGDIVLF